MMHYFASDIHLGAGGGATAAERERRFVAWLDRVAQDAGTIVLAGDIFDFWFEYEDRIPRGYDRVLEKLAELTARGIRIHFFTGNHDMWVLDYLRKACGLTLHPEPGVLELAGRRIFVAHGDNMGFEPAKLRRLNRLFRSERAQRFVREWVPYGLLEWFGRWWSGKSRDARENTDGKDPSVTEPLIGYARAYAVHDHDEVDLFVFGHMHFPRDYEEQGLHVVCLGDWAWGDSYATLDERGEMVLHNDPLSAL